MNKNHSVDQHIGYRIEQLRVSKGLNLTELANQIGVTYPQLRKYEKAINRISASRLFALGKILEVPITYFFEGLE